MATPFSTLPTFPDLRDKVAVVTGGSRGIGAATCLALALNGVKVAVNGRDSAAIQASVEAVQALGGQAIGIQADCSQFTEVERMREQVEARFGHPDYLLAFAGGGTGRPVPVQHVTEADWRSSIDNNLTSTFFLVKSFLPAMLERSSGGIVTMASSGARVASGAPVAYGAAKAGVIMFSRHLANELGPSGIRVNCLSPSAVLTERTRSKIPPDQQEKMLAAFPLGRLGVPDDIAAAALFLLSSSSSWITGVVMDIAGGRVMV